MAKYLIEIDSKDDLAYLVNLLYTTPGGHGHLTDAARNATPKPKMPRKPKNMRALVSGEYSDFHVVGICLSKKDAKEAMLRINAEEGNSYNSVDIDRYPVLDGTVHKVDVLRMSRTFWDDGREEKGYGGREYIQREWDYENPTGLSWLWVRAPVHNNKGGRLDIQGSDHERVRKVFGELCGRLRDKSDPMHLETNLRRP